MPTRADTTHAGAHASTTHASANSVTSLLYNAIANAIAGADLQCH